MIEDCRALRRKAVRIGVNWSSLTRSCLASMMDVHARRSQPWEARSVMYP